MSRVLSTLLGLTLWGAAAGAVAADPLDINFDDIKFDIEKDAPFKREMLTEKIESLNSKLIRIRGFILPASVFQQRGIKQFVLVRDDMECCFGPGAAIYDCILVEMQGSASATFSIRAVAVEGTLTIKEFKYPNGKHYAIYQIDGVKVK